MKAYYQEKCWTILLGDSRELLPSLSDASAIVTDPPYGLGFMGKEWDTFDKSQFGRKGYEGENDLKVKKNFNILPRYNNEGLYEFSLEWAKIARKSCLPGAPLLSFGGTRTFHRIACAIEDAGWEIRDTLMWVYGQGFPKSLDISKAIDKQFEVVREVVGKRAGTYADIRRDKETGQDGLHGGIATQRPRIESFISAPTTPQAQLWEGYGTALKPAYEPIILAMNPLDGTFANNALKHGVAGLNIDECRIAGEPWTRSTPSMQDIRGNRYNSAGDRRLPREPQQMPIRGRFPANFIHDGSQMVMELFPNCQSHPAGRGGQYEGSIFGGGLANSSNCYSDNGSAARFFYCAKASKAERDKGLEDIEVTRCGMMEDDNYPIKTGSGNLRNTIRHNNHPTVNPLTLMEYLVKLVKMPEYNLVIDPFMGSGTTLLACIRLGIPCIGIDNDEKACEIAAKRCSQEVMELV